MKDVYVYIISNKQRKDILHVGTMQFHPNCRLDQLNLCYGVDVCTLEDYFQIEEDELEGVDLDEYLAEFKCPEYASDAYKIEHSVLNNYFEENFYCEQEEASEMSEEDMDRALLGMADFLGLDVLNQEGFLTHMKKAVDDGVLSFGPPPTIEESLKNNLDLETYKKLMSLEDDEKTAFLFELGANSLWKTIKERDKEESDEYIEALSICHMCIEHTLEQNYPLSICFLLESQLRAFSFDEYPCVNIQKLIETLETLTIATEILKEGKFEALAQVARFYALANDVESAKYYWECYWAFINEKDERLLKINICRYIEFCFFRNEKPCSLKKYNAYLSEINDAFIQNIVEEVEPHCQINQSEIYSIISDLVIEAFHKADDSYLEEMKRNKNAILTKIQMQQLLMS